MVSRIINAGENQAIFM